MCDAPPQQENNGRAREVAGLIAAFATAYIAWQANSIADRQAEIAQGQAALARTQNDLSEASRRSALISELTAILDQLNGKQEVPQVLKARMIALSRTLRPYNYIDAHGERTPRPLSPERGQLLVTIAVANLNVEVKEIAFSYADINGIRIENFSAPEIDLTYANLDRAELRKVEWPNGNLGHADLRSAKMNECDLGGAIAPKADFSAATLRNVDFSGAYLLGCSFCGAVLHDVDLRGATVKDSDFSGASLDGAIVDTMDWIKRSGAKIDKKWAVMQEEDLFVLREVHTTHRP